jgi:hydroxymethylbilane synthase
MPAVGQGALALECRADDAETRGLLAAVHDEAAATEIAAERGFLVGIGGDCNTPLAAHARADATSVGLRVQVIDHDGRERLEEQDTAPRADAPALGARLAERLLARGAARFLGR